MKALLELAGYEFDEAGSVRIPIPQSVNIADQTVGRHARGPRADHPALVVDEDGATRTWTYRELDRFASRFAGWLRARGVQRGEPVGIHLGQAVETAVAHLAAYKLGAIAAPISQLYGPDTVTHVVGDSGIKVLVTDSGAWTRLGITLPVNLVFADKSPLGPCMWDCEHSSAADVEAVSTAASDPAILMYTSGSTGMPKGLLHAHRILSAYLPTVQLFYDLQMGEPDLVFWTPSDWAWVGGLLDLVLPAWAHGHTVVASSMRFEASAAFDLMARRGVTHSFMTPTALKRLAEIEMPRKRWELKLRVVCTGGESLPSTIVTWSEEQLGATCNEFYGLTEFNHLVGNCRRLYPIRPGSMGCAYPGHGTTIVDEDGAELPANTVGLVVAPIDDPTLFLGYWNDLGVPQRLRLGERWLSTGDLAMRDAEGYFWYQGRNDDLIKSAGYRIGPAEVEDALLKHPAVAEAAVIGSPDPERGSIVKAFIRLREGQRPSDDLIREVQDLVKRRLAVYKYPREVEFVDDFPLTSSGKIRRAELRRRDIERKADAPHNDK